MYKRRDCIEGAKSCIWYCKNCNIIKYNVQIYQVIWKISKNEDFV